jgi:hypothetical protein
MALHAMALHTMALHAMADGCTVASEKYVESMLPCWHFKVNSAMTLHGKVSRRTMSYSETSEEWILGLCGEVGLFWRMFGGRISGPCREVISIMVPSNRRFHCNRREGIKENRKGRDK